MAIIGEPIKVICINSKSSTILIKGAVYDAISIRTYDKKIVQLKNVGSYFAKFFTLTNGKPLESVPDFSIKREESIDPKNKNYKGQFVKCMYGTGKTLKENEIYYVENQKLTSVVGYNGNTWTDSKIKIRGIRSYVSPHRFTEIPIKEQRNIKLKNLKGEKTKTGEQTRKFLLYSEKERTAILFEILSKVLIDIGKVEIYGKIDIMKLMLGKSKYKYNLIESDIKPFLESNIKNLLKIY